MNRASDRDADSSVSTREELNTAKAQRLPENLWLTWLASLSFANLVYLRAWGYLIPRFSGDLFFRKTLPGFGLYFAVFGDVILLSLLIALTIGIAPKLPGWVRRGLRAAAIAIVVLIGTLAASSRIHILPAKDLPVAAVLGFLAAAGLAYRFSSAASRGLTLAAVAGTPCLAVTFLAPLYFLTAPSPLPGDPPLAPRLAGAPPIRVLWIIFDEWDQRLSFTDRIAGTRLPVLDGLDSRSFVATHALAVQSDMGIPVNKMATLLAIPSLLYGKHVADLKLQGNGSARMYFADGDPPGLFGAGQSIFARVRSSGWNSAVAGWYLPYCRAFGRELYNCYWDESYGKASSASHSPIEAAVDETRMLFETIAFSPFGPTLGTVRHFNEYETLLATAKRNAADPSVGFSFIHFNIPHLPYFDQPRIGGLGYYGYRDDLYSDALERVDSSIGEILKALRGAGLDSKTAIILSSDHPQRQSPQTDPHVPFIVHLPGQETGTVYNREFSTIKTADVALAIAGGGIRTPADIEQFLLR